MGWGNESTLVQLKRDAAKVHRLEAERDELRAENERVGRWIDNYKREQESIIAAWMARIAAVEALCDKFESGWADVKNVSASHTGMPSVLIHTVRAALAASPTPTGPEPATAECEHYGHFTVAGQRYHHNIAYDGARIEKCGPAIPEPTEETP